MTPRRLRGGLRGGVRGEVGGAGAACGWVLLWFAAAWLMVGPVRAAAGGGFAGCGGAGASGRGETRAARNAGPVFGALARGVNVTDALGGAAGTADVEREMRAIGGAGLGHVRLPIRPSQVLAWSGVLRRGGGASAGGWGRLDAVVCAALGQGLVVILDMHPEQDLALRDGADEGVVGRLAAAWDRVAARYAVVAPGSMVFEALNEPGVTDPRVWQRAMGTLLGHIRAAAPLHTVLLTGSPFGTAAALTTLTPVADAHVAYVFHVYSPLVFTHQGADWTTPDRRSIRGLAYPAVAANVAAVGADADPALRPELGRYLAEYGSSGALRSEIGLAARWAARHGVRLVATEFGVFGAADARSRTAWLQDVAATLDAAGIGWSVWEYRGGFGIDDGLARPCGAPGSMRMALHLCPGRGGGR